MTGELLRSLPGTRKRADNWDIWDGRPRGLLRGREGMLPPGRRWVTLDQGL